MHDTGRDMHGPAMCTTRAVWYVVKTEQALATDKGTKKTASLQIGTALRVMHGTN